MVSYHRFKLANGLTCIVHQDPSAQLCGVSVLYKVGSRDESSECTGLAHLFEHLMFSGSKNVKSFDRPLQRAGGENNAFTNNDFTNYYCVVPADNLDTILWLESDRMGHLDLSNKKLQNQKSVVIEEFKETCLNEPYGDVWHHLAPMAYLTHPYRWPVIGQCIQHIERVDLEIAQSFYNRFYDPSNAIISISGPHSPEIIYNKIDYWFSDLPAGKIEKTNIPSEEIQSEQNRKIVRANVPSDALYMAFKTYSRSSYQYYISDLISDILSNGRSSRLYRELVKEKQIFSHIDAYITGTFDPGLLVIEGKISDGFTIEEGERAVWEILNELAQQTVSSKELDKIKNKAESSLIFSELGIMHKAINLCYFEALGDVSIINQEGNIYQSISADDIRRCAADLFDHCKANVLYYLKIGHID